MSYDLWKQCLYACMNLKNVHGLVFKVLTIIFIKNLKKDYHLFEANIKIINCN